VVCCPLPAAAPPATGADVTTGLAPLAEGWPAEKVRAALVLVATVAPLAALTADDFTLLTGAKLALLAGATLWLLLLLTGAKLALLTAAKVGFAPVFAAEVVAFETAAVVAKLVAFGAVAVAAALVAFGAVGADVGACELQGPG